MRCVGRKKKKRPERGGTIGKNGALDGQGRMCESASFLQHLAFYQASENFVDLTTAHHRSCNTGGLCVSVQLVQVCGRVCRDERSLSSTICHIDDRRGAQGNLPVISAPGTVMPGSNKSPRRGRVAGSDGKHAGLFFGFVFDSRAWIDLLRFWRSAWIFPLLSFNHPPDEHGDAFWKFTFKVDFLERCRGAISHKDGIMLYRLGSLLCARDITDQLKMATASSLYRPHSKPNYSDFNHTVYEWLTL